MDYPLVHWDILELLVKRYSRENSLAETCKRLLHVRPTREKYVNAFTVSLKSVKWIGPSKESRLFLVKAIVQQNNLQLLRQIDEEGYLINNEDIAREAAKYGRVDILRWAYDQMASYRWGPWAPSIANIAAKHGHLEVLEFLKTQRRCPWDGYTTSIATEGGHLHILKWLHQHNCPLFKDDCLKVARDPKIREWFKSV